MGIIGKTNTFVDPEVSRTVSSEDLAIMERLVKLIKIGGILEFSEEAHKLAEKHFNMNTPSISGWTCLHYAAYMGHEQIANELIKE